MDRTFKRVLFAYFALVSTLIWTGYLIHDHGSLWWLLLTPFSLRCIIGAVRGR